MGAGCVFTSSPGWSMAGSRKKPAQPPPALVRIHPRSSGALDFVLEISTAIFSKPSRTKSGFSAKTSPSRKTRCRPKSMKVVQTAAPPFASLWTNFRSFSRRKSQTLPPWSPSAMSTPVVSSRRESWSPSCGVPGVIPPFERVPVHVHRPRPASFRRAKSASARS